MITIILVIIIHWVALHKATIRPTISEHCFNIIGSIFIGGAIGFLMSAALPADTTTVTESTPIVALQDGDSGGGPFFLGTGSSNGFMEYTFYYGYDGGYRLKQLSAKNITVRYSDNPRLETVRRVMVDNWKTLIAHDAEYVVKQVIYVPQGTIKTNYNLDAQ